MLVFQEYGPCSCPAALGVEQEVCLLWRFIGGFDGDGVAIGSHKASVGYPLGVLLAGVPMPENIKIGVPSFVPA